MDNKGLITILVLVFGAIFLTLLGGLFGFISLELKMSVEKVGWSEALYAAEAGLDYYKWCVNNEVEGDCLIEKDYYDASGALLGGFSLEVDESVSCGIVNSRQIVSTGWTKDFPNVKREIKITYAKTSIAKYSYVLNDDVWIGEDHEIRGPYHSNGGIRMDGENQSVVSSGQEEWICTELFGCSTCPIGAGCEVVDSNCVCPGVFTTTSNSNENLFSYPEPPFNFAGVTVDLAQIKTAAQSGGVYLPPSTDINQNGKGYHLIFLNNGSVEVRIITSLLNNWAYNNEEDWHYDYFRISSEYVYGVYSLPSSCAVIFVEDNLWPEGEVKGKITVASANLIDANKDTDIVLLGDINYTELDGSDGLAMIGENNVFIGPQSPDNMELRGIFIAQLGRFGRNHYENNFRTKLEINGSVVSNGRVGTQWISGSQIVSGYAERETYFDTNLIYSTPPFVPSASSDYEVIKWDEIN